jgi:protein-disulfide isomerase
VNGRALPRRSLIAAALAAVALGGAAPAPAPDMSLGSRRAAVTVVEYASVGCPHCARWAKEVFPAFKTRFVDTGKVRYVLRETLFGDDTLATAGFLTARCAGPAKYFQVVDAVYRSQEEVARQGNAYIVLLGVAKNAGLTQAQFDACLNDQAAIKALNARSDAAVAAGVHETPSFYVNGKKLVGYQSLDDLSAAIAAARRR